jgi:hypothetical protein
MTATEVKEVLGLRPHPREGGWYVRTYEAAGLINVDARYDGPRRTGTAIYYLLEPGAFSEIHVLESDEIFHHYLGGAVEMLQLWPDGTSKRIVIGKELSVGERPQVVVLRGVWQRSRLVSEEGWALLGVYGKPGI